MCFQKGVTKLLKGVNPSKALGPDELYPRVLKQLAIELGPVLANIFQQSIGTDEIPKEWSLTTTQISAHFSRKMKGVQLSPRFIDLCTIICKLLEHIVCSNIMLILVNINFYETGNMLLGKDIELCDSGVVYSTSKVEKEHISTDGILLKGEIYTSAQNSLLSPITYCDSAQNLSRLCQELFLNFTHICFQNAAV